MKDHKNYFELPFGGNVGLLFSEDMMKRLSKIEAKFLSEIKDVIADNLNECHVYSWTGVKTHVNDGSGFGFPTCYYIDEEDTNEVKLLRMENFHLLGQNLVRRCNHVFLVNGKYTEARHQCEREFIKFLEEQGESVYEEEKKDCGYENHE